MAQLVKLRSDSYASRHVVLKAQIYWYGKTVIAALAIMGFGEGGDRDQP